MYRVAYGWCLEEFEDFATFDEALTFYKGYLACQREQQDPEPSDAGPHMARPDKIDGAEDASIAAQHGLTREEWERVEEVG